MQDELAVRERLERVRRLHRRGGEVPHFRLLLRGERDEPVAGLDRDVEDVLEVGLLELEADARVETDQVRRAMERLHRLVEDALLSVPRRHGSTLDQTRRAGRSSRREPLGGRGDGRPACADGRGGCGAEGVDPLARLMHQSPSRLHGPRTQERFDEPRTPQPSRPGRQRGAREGLPGRPLDALRARASASSSPPRESSRRAPRPSRRRRPPTRPSASPPRTARRCTSSVVNKYFSGLTPGRGLRLRALATESRTSAPPGRRSSGRRRRRSATTRSRTRWSPTR